MVPPSFSFRLSLVCKSWLSLFSSPHFKKLRFELAKSGYGAGRVEQDTPPGEGQAECNTKYPRPSTRKSKKPGSDSKHSGEGPKRESEEPKTEAEGSGNFIFVASDGSAEAFPVNENKFLSGNSEVDARVLCGESHMPRQGKRRSSRRSSRGASSHSKMYNLDGADEFSHSSTEQSGHGGANPIYAGNSGMDDEAAMKEDDLFLAGMSDAVCALEYQPGQLCPGCQPRMSDISYFDENKVYKIGLSFLPEKFQFFLPPDCVVQDGFVCLFKAESFASSNSTAGSDKMKKLSFCVANPITRSWKELPSEVCTHSEYKQWREDWTVRLEVQNNKFTVCLFTPREKDGSLRMTVNTYSSSTGTWKLTFLQHMRYITPAYALEGEGKWPCYTICKGFLCTSNYRRSRLETMVHSIETGELVYFQDDLGTSSEEDDLGEFPPLRVRESSAPTVSYENGMCLPFKVASSCKGFFCAARFFTEDTFAETISTLFGEGHIENAVKMFMKQRRQAGFAVWKLDLSTGVWNKNSKSPMPQKMRRKLMKRPPWNPFKVYKGRGPKDVRILFVDEAVVAGDTVYMFLGVKEDYNFLISDQDLRLWTGMVAYNMSQDSWKLIYDGLAPRLHGNEWHVFRPNFTDLCLY